MEAPADEASATESSSTAPSSGASRKQPRATSQQAPTSTTSGAAKRRKGKEAANPKSLRELVLQALPVLTQGGTKQTNRTILRAKVAKLDAAKKPRFKDNGDWRLVLLALHDEEQIQYFEDSGTITLLQQ